ncbi:MAG: GTPase ObgE [Deltaproteobacteria bacterium]|nr:GTPase ObgE [Deltaproteobacteria bacterium]
MKFIDQAFITVSSGKGGKGCVSFRREKYIQRGGPNGGNGGKGGDVIFKTSAARRTLYRFRFNKELKAGNGQAGGPSLKTGAGGKDIIIEVPQGTIVSDMESGEILKELLDKNQLFTIARGGRGGKGNKHFASSTNRSPKFAQDGEPSKKISLKLELKLLSDVGLIGLPNAGKSTLLSVVSAKKPKIADYPFTTLTPNLGVVKTEYAEPFVMADIPGLIEGAHKGAGLGLQFLKHIEKTKILIHLIDANEIDPDNPKKNYNIVNGELKDYKADLHKKPQIIVISKTDIKDSDVGVKKFQEALSPIEIIEISSHTKKNIDLLCNKIASELSKTENKKDKTDSLPHLFDLQSD